MKAVNKRSIILMAITYLTFVNTQVTGFYFTYIIYDKKFDYNQDLESKIQKSINKTADPCEDFYEYSCGNYKGFQSKEENIQEITEYLDYKFNKKLMKIFEPKSIVQNCLTNLKMCPSIWPKKQNIYVKTQNYYEACIKENRKNFIKYFDELQIKWPLLSAQNKQRLTFSSENFWQIFGQLQGYNWNNVIIKHEIRANKDGTLDIILEPSLIKLPSDNDIEGLLKILNVNKVSEIVQQLNSTEQKWLKIFQNNTSGANTYTQMFLQNITLQYPFLQTYLQQLLDQKINKIHEIWLKNVGFFKQLRDIQWSTEEWNLQLNYLLVNFIFYLFPDSTPEFTNKACIKDLRNKLDLAVNYIYLKETSMYEFWLYENDLDQIKNLIEITIKDLFEENNLNLTSHQIKHLKDKLPNIQINLGNLPYPVNFEKIETVYEEVPDLDKGNYFKNHLLLLKHRFRKSLVYQQDLNFFTTTDNSLGTSSSMFYVSKQNLVVIPFASVQYPLYHYDFNPVYKMSLMGFLMAHEMGHAFDIDGLTTMADNTIVQNDSYMKSVECMQTQEPTEDINERIADLFAERVVYRAYEKYCNAEKNTSWQRQFYLSMAQFFCNHGDVEFIDHDADAVRLHQIVMNSEGFAKAFHCPVDSPMNPQEKCHLY